MRRTANVLVASVTVIMITGSSLIAQRNDPFSGVRNLFRQAGGQPSVVPTNRAGSTPLQLEPILVQTSKSAEILKLLYTNNRPKAITESAKHLASLVSPFLEIDPTKRTAYNSEMNFGSFAKVYGLADGILATLQPMGDSAIEDVIAHAAVAEMLQDTDKALQGYQSALVTNSEHDGVRAKLTILAIESGHQALGLEALSGISKPGLVLLGQELSNRVQSKTENQYDQRLDYVEALAVYFEKVDPSTYIPADWLLMLLDDSIGQGIWGNEIRFNDLYATSTRSVGYDNDDQEAASRLIETRRANIHERLCRALIALPQFSTIGFQRLSGLAAKDEAKLPAFKQMAQQLLIEQADIPERPESLPINSQGYLSNYRENWVPFLSPAEFLLSLSPQENDATHLQKTVIPALEAAGRAKTANFLKEMLALSKAPNNAFMDQAVAIIKKGYPDVAVGNLMRRLLEMVEAQESDADLGPLLMAYFEAIRNENYQSPQFVYSYGQTQSLKGTAAFSKFIDDAAVAMLGPVDGQAAFIKRHYQPNHHDLTSTGNSIHNYAAFLGQMIQSPAMAAPPLKKAAALNLLHPNDYQIRKQVQNNLRYYRFQNQSREVFTFIKEMGFLNSVETLDFVPMMNITRNSVFGYLLYNLGRLGSDDKQTILSLVEAEPKKTLGRAILIASMNASSGTSSQRTAVTNAFEQFMDRILKLPEERQKALRYGYAQYISMNSLSSSLKRSAPKVTAWYEPARSDGRLNNQRQQIQMGSQQQVATAEDFLNTANRQSIEQNASLDYVTSQILQKLPISSAEEFTPIIKHYLKLAKQPLPHSPNVITQAQLGSMLSNWLTSDGAASKLGLVVHCYALDDLEPKPLGETMLQQLRNVMTQLAFSEPSKDAADFLQASTNRYDTRLTPLFLERFATLEPNVIKGIQSWAATEESELAKAWLASSSLALAANAESQALWCALLQDANQSVALRIEAAGIVAPIAVELNAWQLVETAISVYEQAWKTDKVVIPSKQAGTFLIRLLSQPKPQPEQRRLTKRFLDIWTPHFGKTGIGLSLVQKIIQLDASYGIDTASWLHDLPQVVQRQPGFFIMVLQNGSPKQAAAALPWAYLSMPPLPQGTRNRSRRVVQMINGRPQEYSTSSSRSHGQPALGNAQMNKALWDRLQACLTKVDAPGERLFAELLVSGLQDRAADDGIPIRRERLAAINERYDRITFASPYLAEHTLSWLCALNGVTDKTRPAITHFGDQLDYATLSNWHDTELSASRQALLNNYVKDASKNNPAGFARLLTSMLAETDPQRGDAQQLLETYCKGFPKSVFTDVTKIEPAQAASYLPLLKKLGEMSNNVYWNGRDECLVGNIAMHVLAGQGQEYQEWLSNLELKTMGTLVSQTNLEPVIFLLRDRFQDSSLPEDQRARLLNNLFVATSIPEEAKNYVSRSSQTSVYEQMIELNALKVEEILKYGPEWAEMNPRHGTAFGELADYQAKAGQSEEAILNYLQAVVHSPKSDRKNYTRFHIAKTELLLGMNRVDAAAAWVDFFDRGRLDSNLKSEFEAITKRSRQRYLASPSRLDQLLADSRAHLRQNERHSDSWGTIAEVLGAQGSALMDRSDYIRGLSFLKLSVYIYAKLDQAKIEFDKDLFKGTKQDLARGILALGLGGKKKTILSKGLVWDYHYQHGGISRPNWRWQNFPMTTEWKKGAAPLGYGDKDETTILNYGDDKENKPITAYFRKVFEIENPDDFDELTLAVLHDDGVIVYLNNKLVLRNNMPRGTISPESLAPESRGSSVENKFFASTFSAEQLVTGTNVIAAEVHQNDPDSSDLGFDLEITAEAVSISEISQEVETGKVFQRLKAWQSKLPEGMIDTLRAL
ncbi:hypothetical protein N8525_00410 [Verrucomicrobiales bacterium]|nr:hypothetical protein [Verrucomicrobiales bacterium]